MVFRFQILHSTHRLPSKQASTIHSLSPLNTTTTTFLEEFLFIQHGKGITNEMHTKWAHYFEFTITRPRHFFALALEIVRKIIHSPTFFLQHLCIGLLGQIRGSHFHRSAQIGSAWTSKTVQPHPTGWQMSCHQEVNLFGLIMDFLGGYVRGFLTKQDSIIFMTKIRQHLSSSYYLVNS